MTEKYQDFRQMTADTVGKDLLGALVTEIKLFDECGFIPVIKND